MWRCLFLSVFWGKRNGRIPICFPIAFARRQPYGTILVEVGGFIPNFYATSRVLYKQLLSQVSIFFSSFSSVFHFSNPFKFYSICINILRNPQLTIYIYNIRESIRKFTYFANSISVSTMRLKRDSSLLLERIIQIT